MVRSLLRILLAALLLVAAFAVVAWTALRWTGHELSIRQAAVPSEFTYAAGALDDGLSAGGAELAQGVGGRPKNLVVLLADGLGFAQLAAARVALAGAQGRLTVERFPVTSWHTTFSSDGMYTDSAAGASALATGVLTATGRLSVDSAGRPVATLMEEALAAGKSAAVLTDSYLWDASPAAWLAHDESRRHYDEVARQMAASGVTLAFGERRQSDPEARSAARLAFFREAGFAVVRDPAAIEAALDGDQPVVGLFGESSVADPDVGPELSDLTALALRRLSRNPLGFVLFVETEETDSGSHNFDLDRTIRGLGSLDAAARRVVDFARDRDDTLVVFTGDHETGGLALATIDDGEPLQALWGWPHHTGAPVPILAWGAGAEHLVGVHDNAQVGQILRGLLTGPSAP